LTCWQKCDQCSWLERQFHAPHYNSDRVRELDIRVGDTVIVRKAGEIIPEVVRVQNSASNTNPFQMPVNCPVCSQPAVRPAGEADEVR